MNIGLGMIAVPFAMIFIVLGVLSRKKKYKFVGTGLLVAGMIILSVSVLLLTGIYDPYADHIR